jgi:hypothetical protein
MQVLMRSGNEENVRRTEHIYVGRKRRGKKVKGGTAAGSWSLVIATKRSDRTVLWVKMIISMFEVA